MGTSVINNQWLLVACLLLGSGLFSLASTSPQNTETAGKNKGNSLADFKKAIKVLSVQVKANMKTIPTGYTKGQCYQILTVAEIYPEPCLQAYEADKASFTDLQQAMAILVNCLPKDQIKASINYPANLNHNILHERFIHEPSYFDSSNYYNGNFDFAKSCTTHQDIPKASLNDIYRPISNNENGCPLFMSNLFQNVFLSYHNQLDDTNKKVVAVNEGLNELCDQKTPVLYGASVVKSVPGLSDADILVPLTSNAKHDFEICGIKMTITGVTLVGECDISVNHKYPMSVTMCNEETNRSTGFIVDDLTGTKEIQLQYSIWPMYNIIYGPTEIWRNVKRVESRTLGTIEPKECKSINPISTSGEWIKHYRIKCGNNLVEENMKHDILEVCENKYHSRIQSFICQYYQQIKLLMVLIIVSLIIRIMKNFKAIKLVLLPYYIVSKPVEAVLNVLPTKCDYCGMVLINPLHECKQLCRCGRFFDTKGSLPEHDCPLKKRNIYKKTDVPVVDLNHFNNLSKAESSALIEKNVGLPYEKTTEPVTPKTPLATPLNRGLAKILFYFSLFTLVNFILPRTLAYEINPLQYVFCNDNMVVIKVNSHNQIGLINRIQSFEPQRCNTDNSYKLKMLGMFCMNYHQLFNDYPDLASLPKPVLTDLFSQIFSLDYLSTLTPALATVLNSKSNEDYCSDIIIRLKELYDDQVLQEGKQIDKAESETNSPVAKEDKIIDSLDQNPLQKNPELTQLYSINEKQDFDFVGHSQQANSDIASELDTDVLKRMKLDKYTASIMDYFKINKTLPNFTLNTIPYHSEVTNDNTFALQIRVAARAFEVSSLQLYNGLKQLPFKMSIYVQSAIHKYKYKYLYTTAKLSNADVYMAYKCVEGCQNCYSELDSNMPQTMLNKMTHKQCWPDVNNWACEGKGCWTINTGSLCAYCDVKPTGEKTDVYQVVKIEPEITLCVLINGNQGCQIFNHDVTVTKPWGQIKVELEAKDTIIQPNEIFAHERKTGNIYKGNILNLMADGNGFGLPQFSKNDELIHDKPDMELSWQCHNQDKFEIQVKSCTTSTYELINRLDLTGLHFKGEHLIDYNTHNGNFDMMLKVPKENFKWLEPDKTISVNMKIISVKGCANCEKLGELVFEVKSNTNGMSLIDCTGMSILGNNIQLKPTSQRIMKMIKLEADNSESVNCTILTASGVTMSNSTYKIKKDDIYKELKLSDYNKTKLMLTQHNLQGFGFEATVPDWINNNPLTKWVHDKIVQFCIITTSIMSGIAILLMLYKRLKFSVPKFPQPSFKIPSKLE